MEEIRYNIAPTQQQESHDCVQTTASLLLSYYGIQKSVSEIKIEVPVYINSEGKAIGSSVGHMAAYFSDLGLKTTLHTSDVQLFDQRWKDLPPTTLIASLKNRKPYIRHATYDQETLGVICDGFVQLLEKGGKLAMPVVDEVYLHSLLTSGPIFCAVNYQYLFATSRTLFNTDGSTNGDAVQGQPITHAITITGYKDSQFEIIDSVRKPEEAKLWVSASRLIAAYHLADIDLDSVLITIKE